jgi:hypothetical protein
VEWVGGEGRDVLMVEIVSIVDQGLGHRPGAGHQPVAGIDEDEFVTRLVSGLGSFPTYFRQLPEINRRAPASTSACPTWLGSTARPCGAISLTGRCSSTRARPRRTRGRIHRERSPSDTDRLSPAGSAGSLLSTGRSCSCGHGERAMTGASLLEAGGHRGLSVLVGGPADWRDATGIDLQIG